MNFENLSRDPFEARYKLLEDCFNPIAKATIDYIQKEYLYKDDLYLCLEFMDLDLLVTSRSDLETLKRIWLFPASETYDELSESMYRMLQSAYKSAYDNIRRALEVFVVGAYFSLNEINPNHGREWLSSERQTPFFSRAIKALLNNVRVNNLERDTLWVTKLNNLYWYLSDIIHIRGQKYSLDSIQPSNFSYNGIRTNQFSKISIERLLNTFILTFKNICTCIAITNPILLIGLPLDEKFGIDPPFSGFFDILQSKRLWNLLIPETKPFFQEMLITDTEINSISEWMNHLPDLSEADFQKQIDDFNIFMKSMNKSSD